MMFDCGLQNIFQLKSGQSRSINWENRKGEKGTIRIWLFHQDVFVVGGITGCYTVSVGK